MRGGRKERRRKLGLPEELTAEEQAAEAARQAEKAGEAAKKRLPVKPVTKINRMREILVDMKKASDPVCTLVQSVEPVCAADFHPLHMYWGHNQYLLARAMPTMTRTHTIVLMSMPERRVHVGGVPNMLQDVNSVLPQRVQQSRGRQQAAHQGGWQGAH